MMSGTFSSIMRAGCCSATLIGRSCWPGGYHCRPGWHRHFVYRQHPWVSIFFKALRGGAALHLPVVWWYTLFCFAMQGAAGALLCARGQKLARERWCFSTLGGLLFVMLPTLWERARSAIPRWPASGCFCWRCMPFWNTVQNLHSGTAKFPWAMPVLAFWRWASTRTFCRWS